MTKQELFKEIKKAKAFTKFCMTLSQISASYYAESLNGKYSENHYGEKYEERRFLNDYFELLGALKKEGLPEFIDNIKNQWTYKPIITIQQ